MRGRGVRLQKYLSRAGVASRRKSEELMRQGRVRVNGRIVTAMGVRIEPGKDRVEVDGEPVGLPPERWILLHKPPGYVTTRKDPRGRPTVYDLLPDAAREEGLRYVGRLDRNTEGLLLLTNQGDAVHGLTHPSNEVPREYRTWVTGVPTPGALERLRKGVELEDGPARAEEVRLLREKGDRALVGLVLREGRKREVRRMLRAVGHPVRRLRRIRFGPLELGDLPRGEWRELKPGEIRALKAAAGVA